MSAPSPVHFDSLFTEYIGFRLLMLKPKRIQTGRIPKQYWSQIPRAAGSSTNSFLQARSLAAGIVAATGIADPTPLSQRYQGALGSRHGGSWRRGDSRHCPGDELDRGALSLSGTSSPLGSNSATSSRSPSSLGALLKEGNRLEVQNGGMKRELKLNQDFVPFSFSSSADVTGALVFARYGASATKIQLRRLRAHRCERQNCTHPALRTIRFCR